MIEDPRRGVIQVIARLGRETQLHLDERYRNFRITDGILLFTSVLLVILAVFNVYYVRILYEDFNGIITNMDSMYNHLRSIDEDMNDVTKQMAAFDKHTDHMKPIHDNMMVLDKTMPRIRNNMDSIARDMVGIEQSMKLIGQGMGVIDQRVYLMTGGVATMRQNVHQIARPFGHVGAFLP